MSKPTLAQNTFVMLDKKDESVGNLDVNVDFDQKKGFNKVGRGDSSTSNG